MFVLLDEAAVIASLGGSVRLDGLGPGHNGEQTQHPYIAEEEIRR